MPQRQPARLSRTLGFWTLTIYGVGDILGAGVYAVVSEVANVARSASWLSFGVAMVVAGLTAASYAELSSRFPRSGGAAHYCHAAFRRRTVALLVGWLVFCSGVVSMAAVSHAFADYLSQLWPAVSTAQAIVGFLAVLGLINLLGIRLSSAANLGCTLVETTGLLIVAVVGLVYLASGGQNQTVVAEATAWRPILHGSALAFFSFIGFEDLANVAEEARAPTRNLPAAILTAVAVAGLLYGLVVFLATAVVPADLLASSRAPLLAVVRRAAPAFPVGLFTIIALVAVANTALLNGVMASRLLYGMSRQRLLPRALAQVSTLFHSPYWAIGVVTGAALGLAFLETLNTLAATTSLLLLIVFLTTHAARVLLKVRRGARPSAFRVPLVLPLLGAMTCLVLLAFQPARSWFTAAWITLAGVLLVVLPWHICRRRHRARAGRTGVPAPPDGDTARHATPDKPL